MGFELFILLGWVGFCDFLGGCYGMFLMRRVGVGGFWFLGLIFVDFVC